MEYSVSNILFCLGNLSNLGMIVIPCCLLPSRRPPAPGMVRLLPAGHGHSWGAGLGLVQTPGSQPTSSSDISATTCQGAGDQEEQTSDEGRTQGRAQGGDQGGD